MVLGSIMAAAHGAALPLMIIVFGDMTDLFVFDGIFKNFLDTYWDCCIAKYNHTYDEIMENPELIK